MLWHILVFAATLSICRQRGYRSPASGILSVAAFILIDGGLNVSFHPQDGEWPIATMLILDAISAAITLGFVTLVVSRLPIRQLRNLPKKINFPYLGAGICLVFVSFAVAVYAFRSYGPGAAATSFILINSFAATCFRLDAQKYAKSARDVILGDSRSPVLFLRSFAAEKAFTYHPRTKTAFLPFHPSSVRHSEGITFDEFVANEINKNIGPMIALGDPDDYLPAPGSAKVYEKDDSWHEVVVDFIGRASAIVLLEGDTPGLQWEFEHIRQCVSPQRVFIVTHPQTFKRRGTIRSRNLRPEIWAPFIELLNASGFPSIPDPGPGAVIHFSEQWEPYTVVVGATESIEYTVAIREVINISSIQKHVDLDEKEISMPFSVFLPPSLTMETQVQSITSDEEEKISAESERLPVGRSQCRQTLGASTEEVLHVKKGWLAYAVLMLLFLLLGEATNPAKGEPVTAFRVVIWATIALKYVAVFGYALQKKIFTVEVWKFTVWLIIGIDYIITAAVVYSYGVVALVGVLVLLPNYVAMYWYAYRSEPIWQSAST